MAAAVANFKGTGACARGQRGAAQVITPDPVIAGHGDQHLVVGDGQTLRVVQRRATGRRQRAFDRLAGTTGAAQGIHLPAAQVDTTQRMVAGIGDIQLITFQRQTLRTPKCRLADTAVDEISIAMPELAQHAPAVRALEHAVVAGIGDIQPVFGRRQTSRKAQCQMRLGLALGHAVQVGVRRRRLAFAQGSQGLVQIAGDAHQALPLAAVGIQQHQRGPGFDTEATPGFPVLVEQDRRTHAVSAQLFKRALRQAFAVETRHLHHDHLEPARAARLPVGKLGQAFCAPHRAGVDERQHQRTPAMLLQGGGPGIEPGGKFRQFLGELGVHAVIMPKRD